MKSNPSPSVPLNLCAPVGVTGTTLPASPEGVACVPAESFLGILIAPDGTRHFSCYDAPGMTQERSEAMEYANKEAAEKACLYRLGKGEAYWGSERSARESMAKGMAGWTYSVETANDAPHKPVCPVHNFPLEFHGYIPTPPDSSTPEEDWRCVECDSPSPSEPVKVLPDSCTMVLTEHTLTEWARLAADAYKAGHTMIGDKFSTARTCPAGSRLPIREFDALQAVYCGWLALGWARALEVWSERFPTSPIYSQPEPLPASPVKDTPENEPVHCLCECGQVHPIGEDCPSPASPVDSVGKPADFSTLTSIFDKAELEGLRASHAAKDAKIKALEDKFREIETICTESPADCRKRMGTRVGNVLVIARAALALPCA